MGNTEVQIVGNTKKCFKCKQFFPFSCFNKEKTVGCGLSSYCKGCLKLKPKQKRIYKYNPNGAKKARKYDLRKIYNLSYEDYEYMLEKQSNLCAICGRPEVVKSKKGNVKELSIDHHHESGRVRGLLCHACNIGLGQFKDDPQLLESAIKYLKNS